MNSTYQSSKLNTVKSKKEDLRVNENVEDLKKEMEKMVNEIKNEIKNERLEEFIKKIKNYHDILNKIDDLIKKDKKQKIK